MSRMTRYEPPSEMIGHQREVQGFARPLVMSRAFLYEVQSHVQDGSTASAKRRKCVRKDSIRHCRIIHKTTRYIQACNDQVDIRCRYLGCRNEVVLFFQSIEKNLGEAMKPLVLLLYRR